MINNFKYTSVSKILNYYFDSVDIYSEPIQSGILRGNILDYSINNNFLNKENILDKNALYKSVNNENTKRKFDDIYKEGIKCYDAFILFQNVTHFNFISNQTYFKNEDFKIHGYVDAVIEFDDRKYIVDWKSKKEFKSYYYPNESSIKVEYKKYKKNKELNNQSFINYETFKKYSLINGKNYSLSHLRYCLQVALYKHLLGKEYKDHECIIIYFSSMEKYHIYTFDFSKILLICKTLIKFMNKNELQKFEINKKLKLLKWQKFINWRKIN